MPFVTGDHWMGGIRVAVDSSWRPAAALGQEMLGFPPVLRVTSRDTLAGPAVMHMPGENCDVLPVGSVAVAVTRSPAATAAGNVTEKVPLPVGSVVRAAAPR